MIIYSGFPNLFPCRDAKVQNYKNKHKNNNDHFRELVYYRAFPLQTSFLKRYFCHTWGNIIVVLYLYKEINKDVDKDNEGDIHDKEEEPDIDMLEISGLGERRVNRGEESSEDEETGESPHEPVSKVRSVDEKSKVSNQPQEEILEKSC